MPNTLEKAQIKVYSKQKEDQSQVNNYQFQNGVEKQINDQNQFDNDRTDYFAKNFDQKYLNQQHSKVHDDLQDFEQLNNEIQRLKQIKNQYKDQKKSIKSLTKIVQSLKSENKTLQLQKESLKHSFSKSLKKEPVKSSKRRAQNSFSYENKDKQISNSHFDSNKFIKKTNYVSNCNKIYKGNEKIHRFLSPQANNVNTQDKSDRISPRQLQMNKVSMIDQQIILRTHQQNKRSVIASFVSELKHELEQNQIFLQRQKRSHRQTKQKLEICQRELSNLRLIVQRNKNDDTLERQNIQLRRQLQLEIQQRLIAQQKLREKQIFLEYGNIFSCKSSDFDKELDKMDEIYMKMEKTLKFN